MLLNSAPFIVNLRRLECTSCYFFFVIPIEITHFHLAVYVFNCCFFIHECLPVQKSIDVGIVATKIQTREDMLRFSSFTISCIANVRNALYRRQDGSLTVQIDDMIVCIVSYLPAHKNRFKFNLSLMVNDCRIYYHCRFIGICGQHIARTHLNKIANLLECLIS